MKPPVKSLIMYGVQHFGTAIFVLSAALSLASSGLTALVLIEIAYIIFKATEWLYFYHDSSFKYQLGLFFRSVSAGAIAVVVLGIVGLYMEDAAAKGIFELITKIVAAILAVPLIVPVTPTDRAEDKFLMSCRKLSGIQNTIYKLLSVLYRLFVIAGLVLIIVKGDSTSYFEGFAITGFILWFCRITFILYCWWNCQLDDEYSREQASGGIPYGRTAESSYADGVLSEREVNNIVKKIADRWSHKEDTSSMLSGGGNIRYNVTVEVSGSVIDFTINGRLSGVKEEQLSSAHTYLGGKLDKAAYKIIEETKKELSKHNLPQSAYDINVNKGYIE